MGAARLGGCVLLLILLWAHQAQAARAASGLRATAAIAHFPVSAHRGVVVYSRYRRQTGLYHLVARRRGVVQRLPVRPLRRPFEVDLGTDRRGWLVATYARCQSLRAHRDCNIYVYTFADRSERRLDRFSSASASEYLPTMWNGRVAYVRRTPKGPPRIRLDGRSTRGGPRSHGEAATVRSLDLGAAGLLFVWDYIPATCPGPEPREGPSADAVILTRRDGSQATLAAGCNSELPTTNFVNAVLERGHAYFTYENYQRLDDSLLPDARLRRIDLGSGRVADSDRTLSDYVAVDRGRVYVGGTRQRPARRVRVVFER